VPVLQDSDSRGADVNDKQKPDEEVLHVHELWLGKLYALVNDGFWRFFDEFCDFPM